MKLLRPTLLLIASTSALAGVAAHAGPRPPAVPLVTHDPYFSVWSDRDKLTDDWSRHWTGSIQAACGLVRIDGKPFRFMGPMPDAVPPMNQVGLDVLPTRTLYRFEAGGIRLGLTFTTPSLPDDIDVLSRPLTYVTFDAAATDGRPHQVSLYFDVTGEWAVDKPNQAVVVKKASPAGMHALAIGTEEQKVLGRAGDNLRIDWGYLYLASDAADRSRLVSTDDRSGRDGFVETGKPRVGADADRFPRAASDHWPVLALTEEFGSVGNSPEHRMAEIAYDDLYSITYMGQKLRPYWRRNGMDAERLLSTAQSEYSTLRRRCEEFDHKLMADLARSGGEHYAQICSLSYRECLAAHKIAAGADGTPLMFPKENFSNGCISTVDVIYPSAPFFLLLNPKLLEGQLIPVMDYARSGRWKFPFAPHDLGTYPLANGQVYGGGERDESNQMPVEESGNILILAAALARVEGNPSFAARYWPTLSRWAVYLREKGMDPENQLCTDDFAGHLAHNTNLSLKAIVALGGYARLCEMTGRKKEAKEYRDVARDMARKWAPMANDGDHFRLAFDRPGTWSQKYNLVWDKILELKLFPADVARKEMAFYLAHQNAFGLPLDNRKAYTKLDWSVWTATLSDSPREFQAIIDPLYHFVDASPSRVPLSDWFWTTDGKQVGFQARSVVGGVFIKLLADEARRKHGLPYSAREDSRR